MQRYECSNCHRVSCGWAIRYKLKYKCPVCGSELREISSNNKKYQKVVKDHKRISAFLAK